MNADITFEGIFRRSWCNVRSICVELADQHSTYIPKKLWEQHGGRKKLDPNDTHPCTIIIRPRKGK